MASPRSMTQKKLDTWKSKKKERAMSSCYPNKGERDSWKEYFIPFPPSTIHLPHMCTILINLCDLSSPWICCLILQYMWCKCMLPFQLTWAPHKLSLEVGWKKRSNALVRIYIHTERHEKSYGEVKLWLVFAKIFSKPRVIWQESGGNQSQHRSTLQLPKQLW